MSTELPRYEIKIPCPPQQLAAVEAWVRLHPAHWRVSFPPRQVNNIYFDTIDCQSLNDNLGGIGERDKLRLRWYGPHLEMVRGAQMERKHKEGRVGWKEFWFFDGTLDLTALTWAEVVSRLRAAADKRAALWLGQFPEPALVNCYQRAYYVSADGTMRLTIDSDLRTYSQRLAVRPNLRRPAPLSERTVIELKAEPAAARRLSDALASFPLRPDRHSKYVQGLLAGPDFDGVDLP